MRLMGGVWVESTRTSKPGGAGSPTLRMTILRCNEIAASGARVVRRANASARASTWRDRPFESHVTAVETSTCGDLRQLADSVASEIGGGNFSQVCELAGAARPRTGQPLTAPFSERPAVWFHTKVSEEYYDWEYRGTGEDRWPRSLQPGPRPKAAALIIVDR